MTVFLGDRPLLDAFRRGDRPALAAVYFHYVGDLAAMVRNGFAIPASGTRVRGAADEQTERDLVQEVFARAFAPAARAAYDGIRPYGAYLRRIAKNLMIDRVRAAGPAVSLDDDDAQLVVAPEAAELDPEWVEQRQVTSEFIAGLAPELRTLVMLRFEDELSQNQVADALGISRRRVRTLEGRIERGLRKALRSAELRKKDRPESALPRMGAR
jgi:RNA polymerase sigma factor (sigma-70 family)